MAHRVSLQLIRALIRLTFRQRFQRTIPVVILRKGPRHTLLMSRRFYRPRVHRFVRQEIPQVSRVPSHRDGHLRDLHMNRRLLQQSAP